MPEQPEPKHLPFQPASVARRERIESPIRYAELHCCTNFSFLEGASHPEELAARAAELGYEALAITDRNSLAGVVRAHVAAKDAKLKLLVGALVTPVDASPLLLWATNRAAYGRLSRLLTLGRRAAPKGECLLHFDDIADHAAGLLAGVLLPEAIGYNLRRYREIFGDRCYAVAELRRGQQDRFRLQQMAKTGARRGCRSSPLMMCITTFRAAGRCTMCSSPFAMAAPSPNWANDDSPTPSGT